MDNPVTPGVLAATIRQVPGIRDVRRYQRKDVDRLYLAFSSGETVTGVYVDLRTGEVEFNRSQLKWNLGSLWRYDPQGLGERAVKTVRALCETYRRERVQELQRSVTA
jgi:hypothetical protein